MQSGKYKKLLSDTVLFSISNFGSKILVFLLVPLYTNVLSTSDYGIVDLIISLANLFIPVLTFAIAEAVLRFAFDKNIEKRQVLSLASLLIVLSTIILLFCKPIASCLNTEFANYWNYFIAVYFLMALNGVLGNYTRGLDKTKLFAVSGIVYTVSLITFNILFLLVFKLGLVGYLWALILTEIVCILTKIFGGGYLKDLLSFSFNPKLSKEMIKYSLPIMPSSIAWWVMQISDKYIIVAALSFAASGIYSVAYKIPSILATLTSIFTQAWQISAIKSHGDNDNANFVQNVYKYFMICSIAICSVLIMLAKPMGYVLYAKDYFIAWTYVPLLLVAYHFSGLSGVIASVYSAAKKTSMLFISTSVGAVLNIVLNILLIPKYGAIAAAYTTLASFFVTWIIRMIHARTLIDIKLNYSKFACSFVLLFIQAVIVSMNIKYMFLLSVLIICIQFVLFIPEFKFICSTIFKRQKK